VGLEEPLRAAVASLPSEIRLALIYGSVSKRTDTSTSDIDLLIVADDLTLEETYTALAPIEELIERRVNPTLYTSREFDQRRKKIMRS
jgi:predicted nucleotidyltransferase